MTDYRHYIFAGNTKVAIYSRTLAGVNTLHYVREDHQSSAAVILNSDGTPYVKESFTAFGARRSACTWSGPPTSGQLTKMNAVTRHGYTWQTALGSMGLNDMNGRIQDAITGRFLSADPAGVSAGVTQSWNRYSYVGNNPLSYTDPTGFTTTKNLPTDSTLNSPDYNPSLSAAIGGSILGVSLTGVAYQRRCIENGADGYSGCGPWHAVLSYANTGAFGGSGSNGGGGDPGQSGATGGNGAEGPATQQPSTPQQIPCLAGVNCYRQPPPQGHDYRTRNPVCRRPLTTQEQQALISRFTVPNVFTQGRPQSAGINLVANRWGIPGGFVATRFSADGLSGQNATTPFHVFTGVVDRSITNDNGAAYMMTHGSGGYPSVNIPAPGPYASMETGGLNINLGEVLDAINDTTGPDVFNSVDQQASHARAHFPGC